MLQKGIRHHIFQNDVFAGFWVFQPVPWAAIDHFCAELFDRQGITPIAKSTLGVLHDVALVDHGHTGFLVVDGVLNGLSHQALRALFRDGLDANARGEWKTHLFNPQITDQEIDQLFGLVTLRLKLNASINIL